MAAHGDSKRCGPVEEKPTVAAPSTATIATPGTGVGDLMGEKAFPAAMTEHGALLYDDVPPVRDPTQGDDTSGATSTLISIRTAEKVAQEQLLTLQLSELLAIGASQPPPASMSSPLFGRRSSQTGPTSTISPQNQSAQQRPSSPPPQQQPSSTSSPTNAIMSPSRTGARLSVSQPTSIRQFRWNDLDFLNATQLVLLTKLCQALERNTTLESLRVIGAKSSLDRIHLHQEVCHHVRVLFVLCIQPSL
jgi:hypothetical protein